MPKISQVSLSEMKLKIKSFLKKYLLRVVIVTGSVVLVSLAGITSYLIAYNGKIYPNISIAGFNVAGSDPNTARSILAKNVAAPKTITLEFQDQFFDVKPQDLDLSYDIEGSVENAYTYSRNEDIFSDIEKRIILLFSSKNFSLVTNLNKDKLNNLVSIIAGQISIDAVDPSVSKNGDNLVVNKGTPGREVNQDKLKWEIINNLSLANFEPITIPVDIIDNTINEAQASAFLARANNFIGKSIVLKFEFTNTTISDNDIFKLLAAPGGYNDNAISQLIEKTAPLVEREAQNPKFVFENGKVTVFQPALDGIKIDKELFRDILIEKLSSLEKDSGKTIALDIPVVKDPPKINTADVNDYGIKELIGRGTSTYFHSIPGRVHNVALAASRINGTLVKPGETFSFNTALGDVSAFTGYQQAYIISNGKTILGDGGGVCQVSTTLFRALLNAGLPITERQAHAYRVGYYEQDSPPGMDATVFSPSPDLKFINDTYHYILIEAKADTKNYSLVFELYGTKDGRTATVSKPVVTNITAPPPDIYQDDPTLPVGTIKQIDFKAWGAKATFHYVVTKGGVEIINKTFISNYKPWAAVFLRGTGPAN